MSSYESNIIEQPSEWKRLLDDGLPEELKNINYKRIFFVGAGSSYCVARFAEILWREYVINCNSRAIEPLAVQSFDFVGSRCHVSNTDMVVVFSHRARKSFSVKVLEKANKCGAGTVLITGIGSPHNPKADIRIETCLQEHGEAHTISVTSAIVRIVQWIGLHNRSLLQKFRVTTDVMERSIPFKIEKIPKFTANMVIVGDLIREIVSNETAFKLAETAYIPVRSFGLEEFLHGHHLTLDKSSSLVIFSTMLEPRRRTLINYGKAVGCEVICIDAEKFDTTPKEFRWLCQLVWGQQLALAMSKQLNTNPDNAREDQYIYREARKVLRL